MTERFVWIAGKKPYTRHLAAYDRLGRFAGVLCGRDGTPFNRSCNLPLGHHVCRNCLRVERSIR